MLIIPECWEVLNKQDVSISNIRKMPSVPLLARIKDEGRTWALPEKVTCMCIAVSVGFCLDMDIFCFHACLSMTYPYNWQLYCRFIEKKSRHIDIVGYKETKTIPVLDLISLLQCME